MHVLGANNLDIFKRLQIIISLNNLQNLILVDILSCLVDHFVAVIVPGHFVIVQVNIADFQNILGSRGVLAVGRTEVLLTDNRRGRVQPPLALFLGAFRRRVS